MPSCGHLEDHLLSLTPKTEVTLVHWEAVWKYHGLQKAKSRSLVSSRSCLIPKRSWFSKQYEIECTDPEFCVLVSKDGFWPVGETSTLVLNEHVSIIFFTLQISGPTPHSPTYFVSLRLFLPLREAWERRWPVTRARLHTTSADSPKSRHLANVWNSGFHFQWAVGICHDSVPPETSMKPVKPTVKPSG